MRKRVYDFERRMQMRRLIWFMTLLVATLLVGCSSSYDIYYEDILVGKMETKNDEKILKMNTEVFDETTLEVKSENIDEYEVKTKKDVVIVRNEMLKVSELIDKEIREEMETEVYSSPKYEYGFNPSTGKMELFFNYSSTSIREVAVANYYLVYECYEVSGETFTRSQKVKKGVYEEAKIGHITFSPVNYAVVKGQKIAIGEINYYD